MPEILVDGGRSVVQAGGMRLLMSVAAGQPSDARGSGESGAIGAGQASWMERKVVGPGNALVPLEAHRRRLLGPALRE